MCNNQLIISWMKGRPFEVAIDGTHNYMYVEYSNKYRKLSVVDRSVFCSRVFSAVVLVVGKEGEGGSKTYCIIAAKS